MAIENTPCPVLSDSELERYVSACLAWQRRNQLWRKREQELKDQAKEEAAETE